MQEVHNVIYNGLNKIEISSHENNQHNNMQLVADTEKEYKLEGTNWTFKVKAIQTYCLT